MMPLPLSVNPTDTTDHTPLSAPLPGPGGDAGGEKQGVAGKTKDEGHVPKSDLEEQDEKENDVETIGAKRSDDTEKEDGVGDKKDESHQQNATPKEEATETTQHESKTEINSKKNDDIQALLDRDLHHLARPERSVLYHEGVKQQEGGQLEGALKCYLGAITGLSEGSSFEELPKCLHAVADVYFEQKEYEKAVYFIQAEKMYYETALIDIVTIQKDAGSQGERRQSKGDYEQHDEQSHEEPGEESNQDVLKSIDPEEDDLSPNAKKGQEFENLARLCLKEGKLQLALDYCGKATKMYQSVYGEEHPVTIASLDLFTVIYADVGKKLYSDAMQKFEKEEDALKSDKSHDPMSPDSPSTAPELRQRLIKSDGKEVNGVDESRTNEDMIHQGELEPTPIEEHDDWVMTVLLMLIFFLATVFIVIVISSIYCYNNNRTGYCAQTRGDINYWYMYARHLIHDIRKRFR